MTARRARTKLVDLKLSDVDFRAACLWFGIRPELFQQKLLEVRLDREIETTKKKVDQLLERIKKAPPGDRNTLRLFDRFYRLDAKLDALVSARWPKVVTAGGGEP